MDKENAIRNGYITEKAKKFMEAGILDQYLALTSKGKSIFDSVSAMKNEKDFLKIADEEIKKITK